MTVDNEQCKEGEEVEVYGMNGLLVATHKSTGTQTSIDVSQLPSGTYLLKVGRYTAKFVKQ